MVIHVVNEAHHGLLAANEHGETTRKGIFASGDVILSADELALLYKVFPSPDWKVPLDMI